MFKIKFLLLFAFLSGCLLSVAQNSFISELKSKGKDSIIHYSLKKLKEANITNLPADSQKIKVLASNNEIRVLFNMGFRWNESLAQLENYDLIAIIKEKTFTYSPIDYNPSEKQYKLENKQEKIIKFVLKSVACPFRDDERITITEKEYHYEMICSRGLQKGAECYHIDKKSGERTMIWHEHPYPVKDIINQEEEFKEIR